MNLKRFALLLPFLALPACMSESATTPEQANPLPTADARTSKFGGMPWPQRKPIDEVEEDPPFQAPKKADPVLLPDQPPPEDRDAKEPPPEKDPPLGKHLIPLTKDTNNLFFEKAADGKRRVHVLAEVCLREGPLEVLMCKAMTKEHEAILRADLDGRLIHTALIAAGAKPGTPVQFFDKKTEKEDYKPATGTTIKVTLTYHKDGKLLTTPAREWIRDLKTKKDMAHDWVFAGSRFFKDPDRPEAPEYYCANNGEFIAVANFVDSMLDLPIKSPRDQAELVFEINSARVPALRTKVLVTLEPVLENKK